MVDRRSVTNASTNSRNKRCVGRSVTCRRDDPRLRIVACATWPKNGRIVFFQDERWGARDGCSRGAFDEKIPQDGSGGWSLAGTLDDEDRRTQARTETSVRLRDGPGSRWYLGYGTVHGPMRPRCRTPLTNYSSHPCPLSFGVPPSR